MKSIDTCTYRDVYIIIFLIYIYILTPFVSTNMLSYIKRIKSSIYIKKYNLKDKKCIFLLLKIKIYFITHILYRRWNNHNLRLPHYNRFITLINLIVSQIFLQPLILYCYFGNACCAYIFNKKFRRK